MSSVSTLWPLSTHYAAYSGTGLLQPTNIAANDSVDAGAPSGNGTSYGYWGFDAIIPSGAAITAVQVEIKWRSLLATRETFLRVRARVNGVDQTAHDDCHGTSNAYTITTLDLTADRTWTRTNLLDANFELAVAVLTGGVAGAVDYVKITVTFVGGLTLAAGKVSSPAAVRGVGVAVISGLALTVGKVGTSERIRGVSMGLSGQVVTVGKIPSGQRVRGVSVSKAGDPWPTIHVELDKGKPLDANPQWMSVVDTLEGLDTNRARNFELDRYDTGTATLTFDNSKRTWDPLWTGSPLYPYLKPLRRMRFWTVFGGVTNYHFTGYIMRITPTVSSFDGSAQVQVELADAMEVLANWPMATPIPTLQIGAEGRLKIEAVGPRQGGGQSVTFTDPYQGQHVSAPASLVYDGNSLTFGARRSQVSADDWDSFLDTQEAARLLSGNGNTAMIFRGTILASGSLMGFQGGTITSGWPRETVTARITRALNACGWAADLRDLDTSTYYVAGITFSERTGVSAKQVADDAAASEIGLLYIDGFGRVVFKGYAARKNDANSKVSQFTLSDIPAAGEGTYTDATPDYSRDRIYNDIYVEVSSEATGGPQGAGEAGGGGGGLWFPGPGQAIKIRFGPPVPPATLETGTATDQASIDEYGDRALHISTSTSSAGLPQAIATELLRRYKDPHFRITKVTMVPMDGSDPLWHHLLARDISDRITLRWTPPGGAQQLEISCWIEGIHHKLSKATATSPPQWQTQWDLSPVI